MRRQTDEGTNFSTRAMPMDSFDVAYTSTRVPSCPVLAAPQPLGFWGTIVAAELALAVAFVAAVEMALAFRISPTTDKDLFKQVTIVGFLLVFFATILLVCRRRGWRAIDYLALTKPQGHYARNGAAALVSGLAMSVAVILFYVIGDYKLPSISIPSTISGLCIMLIGVVILAPIGEELFFRGFLYRGFAASPLGAAGAIVLTDLMWTAGHLYKPSLGIASVFFFGLLLGWLRWRTGSIIPTIAVHTLNNAIVGLAIAGVTLGWWTA
jgi:membrane protease YdiL (CAAX protease family)